MNAPRFLCTAILLALTPAVFAGELSIHFINVGQGDGALVIGPDGTRVLVDGGPAGAGSGDVVPYLNSIGVTGLDYSIMSHWHTDHYGGMDEVFNAGFQPSIAALDRGSNSMPSGTQVTQYLAAVGAKRQTAFLGQTIALGDGATIEVVAVNGSTPLGSVNPSSFSQSENGRSVGIVVRYKDFDAYLAGDLTSGGSGTANVEDMATSYIGQVEVVKSSHHASKTSSSAAVIAALDPSLVVHSIGVDNQYFHPAKDIIDAWSTAAEARCQWGTTIGDTDNGSSGWTSADGTVVVTTNGYRFRAAPAGTPATFGGANFTTFEHPAVVPGPGSLAISEVMANPAVASDAYGEWFELVNLQPALLDLNGLELRSGSKSFHLASSVVLGFGERIVFGVDGLRYRNGDVWVPIAIPDGNFNLVNSSGNLEVRAPNGVLIDSVIWGTGAAFSVKAGKSAERTDVFAAGVAGNFHDGTASLGAGDLGTPAVKNSPETSVFGNGLVAKGFFFDDNLELEINAPEKVLQFYGLGLSTSANVGTDFLGVHLLIDQSALLAASINLPGAFGSLDLLGRAQVAWPIGGDPGFIGLTIYANYLTFNGAFAGTGVSNLAAITIQ